MSNKKDIKKIVSRLRMLIEERQNNNEVFINTIETLFTLLEE